MDLKFLDDTNNSNNDSELEKLKKENNVKLVEELKAEIESLKNEIDLLKVTTESL